MATIASNLSFIENTAGSITTGSFNTVALPFTFSSNSTEYVRIDTGGNLNVNTATILAGGSKLNVYGNGFISGTLTATTFVGALTGTVTGSATSAGQVQTAAQTASGSYYPTFVSANNASATAMSVYTTSSFTINPQTGAVVYAGLTSSISTTTGALVVTGGVGIGGALYVGSPQVFTTASNWDANKRLINVGGISTLYNDSGVSTYLAHNYYQNGSTSTYITTGTAGYYGISGNSHAWGIASSGTPGNPVTFTQAVTIQTDGSLNVSYVSAQQGAKLSVNGGGYFNGAVTATSLVVNGFTISTASTFNGGTITSPLIINNIAASTSTTTGALQVTGGVGVGGSVYVGNRVGFVNTGNVSVVYQYYNAATSSLDTVFG